MKKEQKARYRRIIKDLKKEVEQLKTENQMHLSQNTRLHNKIIRLEHENELVRKSTAIGAGS